MFEEQRGEGKDDRKAGSDETDAACDGAYRAPEAPRAEDGQLRRRRTREQVGGGDGILELFGVDPLPLIDAQAAQECDMRRWTAETDATQAKPLGDDGAQRNLGRRATRNGSHHQSSLSGSLNAPAA
jgi:hypothetical protein